MILQKIIFVLLHSIEDSVCKDNQVQLTAIRRREELMLEQYDAKGEEPVNDKHDIDDDEEKIQSVVDQDSTATVPVQVNTVIPINPLPCNTK